MRPKRSHNDEFSILTRVFDPNQGSLSPTAAKVFLDLDFKPEDRERLTELAAKAQEGKLTAEEEIEIETYSRVGSFLSVLKSKTRAYMKARKNDSQKKK
jgi:hypothetical protein